MSCIDVSHLSKSYGSLKAVDDIVLSVKPGQVFGFLGPNGAGKSTTIKLLTTLIPPSNGSLKILGIDAIKNPLEIRHKIGVVLQQPSYEPTLSVEKSLDKYGMMWDVPKTQRKERMEQLLKDFDLIEIRKKRNEDLSIGQRRRVQVAKAFSIGFAPEGWSNLSDQFSSKDEEILIKAGLAQKTSRINCMIVFVIVLCFLSSTKKV